MLQEKDLAVQIINEFGRNFDETDVDQVEEHFSCDRRRAVDGLKTASEMGAGRFIVGRGSGKTRIAWYKDQVSKFLDEPVSEPDLGGARDTFTRKQADQTQSNAASLHQYNVKLHRRNVVVTLSLPMELSADDVERIHTFLKFHAGIE